MILLAMFEAISPQFKARIERLSKFDFIGNERAVGLLGAIEFVANSDDHKKFDPIA